LSSNHPTPAGPAPEEEIHLDTRPAGLCSHPRRWLWGTLPLLAVVMVISGCWFWYGRWVGANWREAEAAFQRHDLTSAAAHLDRHLDRRPGDAAAWLLAARTARRLGRYPDAERCLTRCQQLGGVTDATRLEWDLLRVQQGNLGDVHTRLRMTVPPDHPDAPLVLEALARGYLACDRLRDVLEACDLWVSRQPEHPWPYLWRGGVYERLANFHEAMADYKKALEYAPEDREARLSLGGLLARGRQPAAAVEQFEYLLERSPDDEEALLGLASCRIEQGRPEDALPLLDRVLSSNRDQARGLFLRGKAALQQRDAAGAERWLARAVKQAPDDPEALHQLTLALRAQGKQAEAAKLTHGLTALRQDLDRLNSLTRAVARAPDDARLRHDAGVIALRIGRLDEGVRWLQSALRARGDHRPTHAALAEHFGRRGDPRAESHRRLAQTP
jgi:tetratricopeptide (TPR) repeat protein